MITNCNVTLSIASKLSVIVPIHDDDLIKGKRQWYTRVLYNAYSPFNYSFILDTHMFPCYNTSYSELFRRFKESNVDISYANRQNVDSVMGAAVLSKWGPRSFEYWKDVIHFMRRTKCYEDQYSAKAVLNRRSIKYTYKKMSSNWSFASHGITETGFFLGSSHCYRSSVVVTGPVQWIHGNPNQCVLMNGKHNEHVNKYRVYFLCGDCTCNKKGPAVATSEEELKLFVGNLTTPTLLWQNDNANSRSSSSLFWST